MRQIIDTHLETLRIFVKNGLVSIIPRKKKKTRERKRIRKFIYCSFSEIQIVQIVFSRFLVSCEIQEYTRILECPISDNLMIH